VTKQLTHVNIENVWSLQPLWPYSVKMIIGLQCVKRKLQCHDIPATYTLITYLKVTVQVASLNYKPRKY